jgi:hypothetical protein
MPLSPLKRYRRAIGPLTPGKLLNGLSVRARASRSLLSLAGFSANGKVLVTGEKDLDGDSPQDRQSNPGLVICLT